MTATEPIEFLLPTLGFAAFGFVAGLLVWALWRHGRRAASPVRRAAPPLGPLASEDQADSPRLERIEQALGVVADAQAMLITAAHRPEAPTSPKNGGSDEEGDRELHRLLADVRQRLSKPALADSVMDDVRDALAQLPEMIAEQLAARQQADDARLKRLMADLSGAMTRQTRALETTVEEAFSKAMPHLERQATLDSRLGAQAEAMDRHTRASTRLEQQLGVLSRRLSESRAGPDSASAPQPVAQRPHPSPYEPAGGAAPGASRAPQPPKGDDGEPPVKLRPWLRPAIASRAPAEDSAALPPRPRAALPLGNGSAPEEGRDQSDWRREQSN